MKKRLLFVCTGNSARSQMAEAILKDRAGDDWAVYSAGSQPQTVDPRTLAVIAEAGLPTDQIRSKSLSEFEGESFDYVIALCSEATSECSALSFEGRQLAWEFEDPRVRPGFLPFETTFKELERRIDLFLTAHTNRLELTPLNLFKSLADPTRLKTLLLLLSEHELCVCELGVALEESQPKISRHLAQLRSSGLLTDRRVGHWVFYDLNLQLPDWIYRVLQQTLEHNPDLIADPKVRLAEMGERPERAIRCCA